MKKLIAIISGVSLAALVGGISLADGQGAAEDDGDEGKTIGQVDHAKITVGEEVRLAQRGRDPAGPPWKPEPEPITMPELEAPTLEDSNLVIPDMSDCLPCLGLEVKKALQARGYNPGVIDLTFNQTAKEALKRFQADNNLEPDGEITSATLNALGIS